MFGAMAVWVRVNRVGIALQNEEYSRGIDRRSARQPLR
jgi:hypothetical protein